MPPTTEAADGTSGIPSWDEIKARLLAGWRRAGTTAEAGWSLDRAAGVWRGLRDAGGR